MMSFGNLVVVYRLADYERLLALPTSVGGWFSPSESYGEVKFPSPCAAQLARREI